MRNDEPAPTRDPLLGAWLARAEAPPASDADLERLAARIGAAARGQAERPLLARAARWARITVPLAAAAGIAAMLALRGATAADETTGIDGGPPAAAIATALRQPDAGGYLMDVASSGYSDDWARHLTGGTR